MKKLSLILIAFLLVFTTSCDEGDPVVDTPRYDILKNYMTTSGNDIGNIITNADGAKFVAAAPALADLDAFLDKYYIIDIRQADAFSANHIEGAKNISFSNILVEGANAQAAGKPALVVCYTGQTACYATALMRLYGYTNTQALKWGMSGWASDTAGPWNGKIGSNPAQGHANWTTAGAPTTPQFEDTPFINLSSTDGATLLKQRVELVVAAGFKTASGADVLANPDDYYINNFFSNDHYVGFGHIDGAYRINPISFADNSINLDPNGKVVTYCYTGQTSAVITACLNVLGYDAYSLTFGMNGLFYDNPFWTGISNHWGDKYIAGLPYAN